MHHCVSCNKVYKFSFEWYNGILLAKKNIWTSYSKDYLAIRILR